MSAAKSWGCPEAMSLDLRRRKAEIRALVLRKRDELPAAVRRDAGGIIVARILAMEEFRSAAAVLAYCSFGSEIQTTPLLTAVLAAGKALVLPKLNPAGRGLDLYAVRKLESDLVAGIWGIREPRAEVCAPVEMKDVDFVLAPGVAFDRQGGRIGYGKGYYDELLAPLRRPKRGPLVVAAAFEVQVVDAIPMDAHDVPVDVLVTEKGD